MIQFHPLSVLLKHKLPIQLQKDFCCLLSSPQPLSELVYVSTVTNFQIQTKTLEVPEY